MLLCKSTVKSMDIRLLSARNRLVYIKCSNVNKIYAILIESFAIILIIFNITIFTLSLYLTETNILETLF